MHISIHARRLAGLLLASTLVGALAAESSPMPVLSAAPEDSAAALWMSRILSRFPLTPAKVDEALSEKIFKRYLADLDPEHALLTQTDLPSPTKCSTRSRSGSNGPSKRCTRSSISTRCA